MAAQINFVEAQARADGIQMAKQLREKGKYKKASEVLKKYAAKYPKDVNALWLYAQTEFWRRHFRKSKEIYEAAIKLQPDKDLLVLDYAKSLYNKGDWKRSDVILRKMEMQNKIYSDGLLLRARISYSEGDYRRARRETLTAIDSNTQSKAARELYTDIMNALSPSVKIGLSYAADNQPIKTIIPAIEAGVFLHRYSTLDIALSSPVFITGGRVSDAQLFSIGDISSFSKAGLLLKGDAGIDKFPYQNTVSWTGDIYLRETFVRHLVFDALAEHKPYFYTLSSVDTAISTNHFVSTIGWDDRNFINGKAGFDLNYFADGDFTYSLYAYAFAPPVRFSIVQLRFGYGYSYSDSRSSRYVAVSPLDSIVKNWATTTTIAGVYDPYFTPHQQNIHSALVSLALDPHKNISIGADANIGFYAYTQNPYLYLDKDSEGDITIQRGYSRESLVPVDASAYVLWHFAKKYSIKADYRYHRTFFYTSNSASLTLKMNIWK